jgi:hypothetical protein
MDKLAATVTMIAAAIPYLDDWNAKKGPRASWELPGLDDALANDVLIPMISDAASMLKVDVENLNKAGSFSPIPWGPVFSPRDIHSSVEPQIPSGSGTRTQDVPIPASESTKDPLPSAVDAEGANKGTLESIHSPSPAAQPKSEDSGTMAPPGPYPETLFILSPPLKSRNDTQGNGKFSQPPIEVQSDVVIEHLSPGVDSNIEDSGKKSISTEKEPKPFMHADHAADNSKYEIKGSVKRDVIGVRGNRKPIIESGQGEVKEKVQEIKEKVQEIKDKGQQGSSGAGGGSQVYRRGTIGSESSRSDAKKRSSSSTPSDSPVRRSARPKRRLDYKTFNDTGVIVEVPNED